MYVFLYMDIYLYLRVIMQTIWFILLYGREVGFGVFYMFLDLTFFCHPEISDKLLFI